MSTNHITAAPVQQKLAKLAQNLNSVIMGKEECVQKLLVALLADGSVLMEDVPGVGKTTLAKALARSLDLDFQRVQFTPDLLPSDIIGTSIYNPVDGSFTFRQGPIFTNVLLADEINRASPRTQSALLEAMSENQVTVEGQRNPLQKPFLVLATQNPIEFHGTYPLPEAQLDRFFMQLDLGYPSPDIEIKILYDQSEHQPVDELQPVVTAQELIDLQMQVRQVRVEESVSQYLMTIIQNTRTDPQLKLGVSPRGSLMLFRGAQAAALLDGRDYVVPDDVQQLAPSVLAHRVVLTSKTKYANTTKQQVIVEIMDQVSVPT